MTEQAADDQITSNGSIVDNEHPTFQLRSVIEQTPFENHSFQSFFKEWLDANDSIVPQVVDRQFWELKATNGGILEETSEGKKTLYVPSNLRLEEMVGVFERIDQDT